MSETTSEDVTAAIHKKLTAVQEKNADLAKQLADKYKVGLNPFDVLVMKLDTFIEMALSPEQSLTLELAVELKLSEVFEQTLQQLAKQETRQRILEGVPGVDPNAQPLPQNSPFRRP